MDRTVTSSVRNYANTNTHRIRTATVRSPMRPKVTKILSLVVNGLVCAARANRLMLNYFYFNVLV